MPIIHPLFAIGLPHGGEWIWILAIFFLGPALTVWALISCVKNESSSGNTKIVWVLVIVFLHFFGALAYLIYRRPQRIRELGR